MSGFRRAGLTVLIGTVAGSAMTLLLTPVVARLFAPATYGTFATVVAVTSIFVGVSTLRLEVLAQAAVDEGEAGRLQQLALLASMGWGLLITAAAAVLAGVSALSWWWLLVGPLVTVASLRPVGVSVLTRAGKYRTLAWANLVQGAGVGLLQVLGGLVSASVAVLVSGFALSRLTFLPAVRLGRCRWRELRTTWSRARAFALVGGGTAAINSLGGQLPILLGAAWFGQAEVGWLAMAIRVLVSPLAIMGQAAAAGAIGEVGRLLREARPDAPSVVTKGMRDLLVIGLLPCAAAAALGHWLVPLLLGAQWAPAGVLVGWLAMGTLAQLTVAPFSQLLNITGRSRWLLGWDLTRVAVIAAAFGVVRWLDGNLVTAVASYSAGMVGLYVVLGWLCRRAVSHRLPER